MSQVIRYKSINYTEYQSISGPRKLIFRLFMIAFFCNVFGLNALFAKNTNNLVFFLNAKNTRFMGGNSSYQYGSNCDSLVAKFTSIKPDTQCLSSNSFEFKNSSSDTAGMNLNFKWFIGNQLVSTDTNLTYSFNLGGSFTVKLVVQNDSGCMDSTSSNLIVHGLVPKIYSNTPLKQCFQGNDFIFTDSTNTNISYNRNWSIDQSNVGGLAQISKKFNVDNDSIKVKLTLQTSKGCVFDTFLFASVFPSPKIFTTTNSNTRFCDNSYTVDSINFFVATLDSAILQSLNPSKSIQKQFWLVDGTDSVFGNRISYLPSLSGSHIVKQVTITNDGCISDTSFSIIYTQKPTAKFGFKDSSLCLIGNRFEISDSSTAGASDTIGLIQYRVYSKNGVDTLYWQQNQPALKFSMNDTGAIKVISVVESVYGCIDSSVRFAHIHENPHAIITSNISGKCQADLIDFNLKREYFAGESNYNVKWFEGNSVLGTDSTLVYSKSAPGSYTVSLKIISPLGCSDSTSKLFKVQQSPSIVIQKINNDTCVNKSLLLKGVEVGGQKIESYLWKFPDGTQSTDSLVVKRFTSGGTKEIQLFAKVGKENCQGGDTVKIKLYSASTARIFTPNISKCFKGNQFILRDSSKSVGSITSKIKWNFADGSDTMFVPSSSFSQVKHSYGTPGKYNVVLTVFNQYGCIDSTITQLTVNPTPTADFTIDNNTQCLSGNSFNFSDRSISNSIVSGLNYYWNFGDSTIATTANPNKKYTKDGQKNIRFIASNSFGCADTAYSIVQVIPQPVANFGINNSVQCVNNNSFVYTDSSKVKSGGGVIKLSWDFGDGSVSNSSVVTKKYSTTGILKTKLFATTTFGCIDSMEKSIRLMPKPKANFAINNDTQCFVGNAFQFYNNSSIVTGGGSLSYAWNFGDGNVSNSAHPNISYASYGSYAVKLKTTSQFGCSDSLIIPTLVTANPKVSFTFTKPQFQCNNTDTFILTNTTQALNGKGLVYKWDLGDGAISAQVNVQKSYSSAGSYFIKLIATNSIGCIDSVTQKAQVYPDPIVDFSINKNSQCIKDQKFEFTNNSTIGFSGGSLSYIWKYSDTNFATSLNVSKTFGSVKLYPIKLIVKTSNGCSDSVSKNIQIYASPKSDFAVSNLNQCLSNNQFKFTNNSFINVGSNSYSWSFGDGLGSGLNSPTKTYSTIGNFKVKLIATSDNGCIDSISKFVNVYSQPQVLISKSDSAKCLYNNNFTFASTSTNADNSSMSYNWTFGTIGTDTGKSVQRSFPSAGVYLIKLAVKTVNGCKDSVYTNIKIHPQPVPSFNVNSLSQCFAGHSFIANNLSTISGGAALTYGWRFGNGKSDVSKNPSWSYTSSNSYTVTLYANSPEFCVDSVKKIVTVYPTPVVDFKLSDTARCLRNNEFNLTNLSTITSGTLYYAWDFGNVQKSNGTSPSVTYSNAGVYKIKLSAKSSVGCSDSMTKQVSVYAQPTAQFSVNNQMQCYKGNYFQFTNNSTISSGTLSYNWNFGDSTTSNILNPKKSYTFPSSRVVKLKVNSNKGCLDSFNLPISIKPNPTAKFFVNDSIQCLKGNDFIFLNNSKITDGKMVANWNFGDNSIQSSLIGRHTYSSAGFFKVILTMTSNFSCLDTVSKWIKTTEQPVVSFITNQNSTCFSDNLFKTDNTSVYNGTEQVEYIWKFSDGTTSNQFRPDKSFSTDGMKTITLLGITSEGCTDSFIKKVTVYPQGKSAIQLFDTIQCLRGNKFTFGNNSRLEGENFSILSWDFGDGTIDTVFAVRPVTYEYYDTGLFKVELTTTTENLCQDKSFGFVRVVPMPKAQFTQSGISYCQNDQKFEFYASKSMSDVVLKKWELDKVSVLNLDTLKYTFGLPGKYKVKYIQHTSFGCGDTAVSKVIVNEAPIAKILSDKIEQCLETNKFYFTNLSSGNSIPEESWIFHDGPYLDLRTGGSQEVVYEYPGKQLVELIVENDSACMDTASTYVTVNPFPLASISIPNVCQNTPSLIQANATISAGTIEKYEWNLGDGRNTTDSNPTHKYIYPGKYYINLTLKSNKGCSAKYLDSTVIFPKPFARIIVLTPRATILKDTIQFMDSSDNAVSYEWNFGDPQNSTSFETYPKNRYLDTGDFNVQLVVTSADGCVDTTHKTVRVWPDFNLLFPTAFSPNNDGINDDYNVVGHFHSIKDFSMTIFDQHGLKVFETLDINEAWKGSLNNSQLQLPSANYEVIVRVRDLYNKQFSFTKKISLIR